MSAVQPPPPRPRRGCLRVIIRLIRWPALLALTLAAAGYIFEAGAARGDQQRYPPLGEHLIIEGREIHIYCVGNGSPTVILEAGVGGFSLSWQRVQPGISRLTRVCSYDRAGMGWSQPSPGPRTPQQIVAELRALLAEAEIEPPYVLVGHGLGGRYALTFAALHPDEISGLILLDTTHLPLESTGAGRLHNWEWMGTAARFGVARLFGPEIATRLEPDTADMPPEMLREMLVLAYKPWHLEVAAAEMKAAPAADDLLSSLMALGDLPLVVMTPERLPETVAGDWQAAYAATAALSTSGRLVMAENSGALIPYARPDLVSSVIRQVVELVRRS